MKINLIAAALLLVAAPVFVPEQAQICSTPAASAVVANSPNAKIDAISAFMTITFARFQCRISVHQSMTA